MKKLRPQPEPEPTKERRIYSPPRLETFGTLRELTRQLGPGPMSDKGNNMMGFPSG